jgi:prepilin-type N-terminal cleavage/methylation domain-containing protein
MLRNASNDASAARRGYTLIEMLIVISLMSIFAALLLPNFEPSVRDQLRGAAEIIAADLSYARNLAVSHDTKYTIQFRQASNSYVLTHTGTNTTLNVLPVTTYRDASDTPTSHVTYLEDMPHLGPGVSIVGVSTNGGSVTATGSVEFTSLGGLTSGQTFTVWLQCGNDTARRYQSLTIAPVTGLVSMGTFQATAP